MTSRCAQYPRSVSVDRRRFLQLVAGAVAGVAPLRSAAIPSEPLVLRVHRATHNTRAGAIGRALWPPGDPPSSVAAQRGRTRVRLPVAGLLDGPPLAGVARYFAPAARVDSGELRLEMLARLLYLTNGVTRPGRVPLRAAPSAGALYAGEVYVVAERVSGLEPGVYAYQVPGHALVRLASGSRLAAVAAALEQPESIADAPVCFVLTNVFDRYTHRYANRGYRYALIDSGHIGENLRLAAASEGLATCSPLRFHDAALNALLEIDGREEAVCALHAVGRAAASADSAERHSFVEAQRAQGFAAGDDLSEPERYHAATALAPGGAFTARVMERPRKTLAARGRALPERDPPVASVAWAIVERRSAADFEAEPLVLADLAFLLRIARGNPAAVLAPGIEVRVLAHRVDGLEPGVYRYVPETHRLVPLATGEPIADATRSACGGQERAGTAAVGFAMLADLAAAAAPGDRGYRDLLVEAGAIGQRVYLAAESIGLAARNLAAFYDDELNALLRADGRRRAVVHLTMAGRGH